MHKSFLHIRAIILYWQSSASIEWWPLCVRAICAQLSHKQLLYYRDEMVGTQLVAGAFNKEHQAKLLFETASLHSLEDKLDRMCALEKSESSSATLIGQIQSMARVKVVEVKKTDPGKCTTCHKVNKKCSEYIFARLSATIVIRLGMSDTAAPRPRQR